MNNIHQMAQPAICIAVPYSYSFVFSPDGATLSLKGFTFLLDCCEHSINLNSASGSSVSNKQRKIYIVVIIEITVMYKIYNHFNLQLYTN